MLVLREAQWAAFRRISTQQFADDLQAYLRENFPAPCDALGSEARLKEFVAKTIQLAGDRGVESTRGVESLSGVWLQFGHNFERSPLKEWSRNILAHPSLPGDAKAFAIRERHNECTEGSVLIAF